MRLNSICIFLEEVIPTDDLEDDLTRHVVGQLKGKALHAVSAPDFFSEVTSVTSLIKE